MADGMTIVRPVWADPAFILAQNQFRMTTRTVLAAGDKKLAGLDPTRWAIGFASNNSELSVTKPHVHPTADPSAQGWALVQDCRWFSMFEFGPLVCSDWYLTNTSDMTVTVYEVFIQSGGG